MLLSSYLYIIIIYYYKIIYITFWEFRPNLSISERYERCSTPQRLPSGPYAAHMPWSRTGVKATSQKYSGVWSRDPNGKKTEGGGRPPKRLFLGLGSRPAASLRSPDAPAHAPTTPRTPTSRASVKGRDSTVVMEPDGRQIDAASATLRLRPNNPLDFLAHRCPQQRHGAGRDRRHWPHTDAPQPVMQCAGGCRLPGAERVLAKGGNHAPACKKTKSSMAPNRPRAPLQRPRAAAPPRPHQVHCAYHPRGHRQRQQRRYRPEMATSRPRNPWRGRGAVAQVRPRALWRPPSARRGYLQAHIAGAGAT